MVEISGKTQLLAHLGYPTESFKSPMIYNRYFAQYAIDAVVVPMGCRAEDFPAFFPGVTRLSNFLGCLLTMPHKVAVVEYLDEVSTTVKIAGSCNAVRRDGRGRLIGDMFDGDGFSRGVERKGRVLRGASALVIGCGGVGSAIAASLAKSGVARLGLRERNPQIMIKLAERLRAHYPCITVELDSEGGDGHDFDRQHNSEWDIIVNATPLGMQTGDPLPLDVSRIASSTLVCEVVLTQEMTPLLQQSRARGCDVQTGLDMLFEQVPAYLEFFGLPVASPAALRELASI